MVHPLVAVTGRCSGITGSTGPVWDDQPTAARQVPLTQLTNIFRYFADLAPVGRNQDLVHITRRSEFVHLDWSVLTAESASRSPSRPSRRLPVTPDARTERLSAAAEWHRRLAEADYVRPLRWYASDTGLGHLQTIDRLHSHEYLLRLGWLWLMGTPQREGAPEYAIPLASATARLTQTRSGHGRKTFLVEILDDLDVPPGLADEHREQLQEKLSDLLDQVYRRSATGRARPLEGQSLPAATKVVELTRYLSGVVGFGDLPVAGPEISPVSLPRSGPLTLCLAKGIYADSTRRPNPGTVADVLLRWADVDCRGTAFEHIYFPRMGTAPPADSSPPITTLTLNKKQHAVLTRARTEPLTVVSGPPGTGKTHLVAALAIDEIARGNSVLVATQSDHAADVVAGFLERHPGPRFIRFGRRSAVNDVAAELSEGLPPSDPRDESDAKARLVDAEQRLLALASELDTRLAGEIAFARGLDDRQRLAWIGPDISFHPPDADVGELRRLEIQMQRNGGALRRWLSRRARRRLASRVGLPPTSRSSQLRSAVDYIAADQAVQAGLEDHRVDLETLWDQMEAAEGELRRARGRYLALPRKPTRFFDLAPGQSVAALASVLRAGTERRRRLLEELGSAFLRVLPLWIGTLQEIDATLPWVAGMFDLVIFDEASQINQVRAASGLARAKRAVIVGDPKQLRHVSFVGDAQMSDARSRHDIDGELSRILDVRRNSLFDVAAAAPVTVLEEHFRSVPHIIEFSNRRFYEGRLRLMTQHPATESIDAIQLTRVDGRRNKRGVNVAEIDAVRNTVMQLMSGDIRSLGVVSPFRDQTDALERMLLADFDPTRLTRFDVRVGTVHAFQGAESDTVVMSLALDHSEASGLLRFVEDPHLLNVLATRARRQIVVVTSLDEADLPAGLLREYLSYAHHPPSPQVGRPAAGWVAELADGIRAFGLRVIPNYPVAGWTVDLAVGEGAGAVGVDCAVFLDDPRAHIERRLALRRAGWEMIAAHHSTWLSNSGHAIDRIVEHVLDR